MSNSPAIDSNEFRRSSVTSIENVLVKAPLPDPHPNVMRMISTLKPLKLPIISNKKEEGPFRYSAGTYFGNYEAGVRSGVGIFVFAKDGAYYEGTWENDNMSGYGRLIKRDSFY